MSKTTYEVHTLKGGSWQIEATLTDRDAAIESAKQFHAEKIYDGIKVIKDTFDPKTNASKELVIYDTSKPVGERPPPPPPSAKTPATPSEKKDVTPRQHQRPTEPAKSETSVVVKALLWLAALLVLGIVIIYGLYVVAEFMHRRL